MHPLTAVEGDFYKAPKGYEDRPLKSRHSEPLTKAPSMDGVARGGLRGGDVEASKASFGPERLTIQELSHSTARTTMRSPSFVTSAKKHLPRMPTSDDEALHGGALALSLESSLVL